MNPRISPHQLDQIRERHAELTRLLASSDVIADRTRFQVLSQEWSRLDPIIREQACWERLKLEQEEAQRLIQSSSDPELQCMAREELDLITRRLSACGERLDLHLNPPDQLAQASLFLEIRAGTGGDEAALIVGMLFRMYSRYAERSGWSMEVVDHHAGEQGGFKEIISRIEGTSAYPRLLHEAGTHRVQRVPKTEARGRIHTSTATVAVLPEPEGVLDTPLFAPSELRIDTYRASGAGGQHVNKTESAIRITHLPTGIAVECQDERSQHKNRTRALALLGARLLAIQREREAENVQVKRREMVGSGDRAERIRTYNYAQNRVTDHRIGLTLYQLDSILEGDLDPLIEPLVSAARERSGTQSHSG
ncbi:peptide chain release factor 1 [mine drainage metagenome]|uniref:Peptide chain release factor 1 n=2 Tax=mine drainage metagenome TaxID=410659 RepID=T1BDY1_9ZZZZ